jgi:hypothetical protein
VTAQPGGESWRTSCPNTSRRCRSRRPYKAAISSSCCVPETLTHLVSSLLTMSDLPRRARATIRCLLDDLRLDLPGLDTDLGEMEHPLMNELRRLAPTSPRGQKRILTIDGVLVYRIRVSTHRGATWVDDGGEGSAIVWLCASNRREDGSAADAYEQFARLHKSGRLLPSGDDQLRYRAEAAIRPHRGMTDNLLRALADADRLAGTEVRADLGDWLPCRLLIVRGDGLDEVWCALSARSSEGEFVPYENRDLLFAELERHLAPMLLEPRTDWPSGHAGWFEVVRLGLR